MEQQTSSAYITDDLGPGSEQTMGQFNEEWFWVFGYGTAAVIVIVANIMVLCSIGKNAFLHTITHRTFAVLATRHILRAMFGLAVVYITRWSHPTKDWKFSDINSTKAGMPLICDILCTIDVLLLALPVFLLVGLTVHMFTRFPSPPFSISSIPEDGDSKYQVDIRRNIISPEPTWLACLMPIVPILTAVIVALPVPLLHLTHLLQAIPNKYICSDMTPHLTYDISVFIIAYCLPILLMFFLIFGLFVRRCLHCSFSHCCNSWCKEELVLVIQFFTYTVIYALMYLQLVETFVNKLELPLFDWPPLAFVKHWVHPEVARGAEMVHGILLPFLCYLCMPAYRQFCNEPDPDDKRLSTPRGYHKRTSSTSGAVLVGVKSLDLVEESPDRETESVV